MAYIFHYNTMTAHKHILICISTFLLSVILPNVAVHAQWGPPYTNNWISYGKPYVKIGVTQKGIHTVPLTSLPTGFPINQPEKLQLWHRGKQINILSTTNGEIVFYGVPNDGSIDSLLYRPMSSRMNPYTSIYSDESAYFLTVGDGPGLRAETVSQAVDANIPPLQFHLREDVTSYRNEYSISTLSIRPNFYNSFFENGVSKTGVTVVGEKFTNYSLQLTNYVRSSSIKPGIKLMFHGRSNNSRVVEIYVGKDEKTLRLVKSVPSANFAAVEYSFDLSEDDTDANGKGVLSLKTVSSDAKNRYSLAYYKITYPQSIDMTGSKSYNFKFDPASSSSLWSRISVSGLPADAKIYDISDIDSPKIISGAAKDLMVPRQTGKVLTLFASNEVITVAPEKINSINLALISPKDYNYIIITSENLVEGAKNYADYRSSKLGGGYSPVVVKIKDIYSQFNYGEPSPVAIRRFVDYMLSDGNKDKHLFLIGKSITFNERIIRELPDEVPTIGFPGSDILLVEGLAGVGKDIPAIPVGRLSALTNQHINDYLEKVKDYEQNSGDLGWRKKVLHLNGGKTSDEITELKSVLSELVPIVEDGFLGGKVTPFVKKQGISEVETVDITPEVNAGVGMITYFGHGSTTVTDLDLGYITDASRNYNNYDKYPLMYFNGCGVGNVFSGRFNTSPSASDRIALSLDWLLAPKKGSVAILANTFDTFVSTTTHYLDVLYPVLFTDSSSAALSIGQVQKEVARRIITAGANSFDISNIHQGLLQGDPALHMINLPKSDYAINPDEGILLYSDSSDKMLENSEILRTEVVVSNLGKYNKEEKVPVQVKLYYKDGTSDIRTVTVPAIAYQDTLIVSVPNKQNVTRVEVEIDHENTLKETNRTNNIAELEVNWDDAKKQTVYPAEKLKDVIPPILYVTIDSRMIKNDDDIRPNPEIVLTLTDDRILLLDTTLLNIYIKPCGDNSCDYARLSFSDKNLIVSQGLDNRTLKIQYLPATMQPGVYSLLVNAKDRAGNSSLLPYEIRFNVDEASGQIVLTSSPNPATTYVRFQASGYNPDAVSSVTVVIYDLRGVELHTQEVDLSTFGNSEWYWFPQNGSGTFVYKALFKEKSGKEKQFTGKMQIVK